MNEKKYYYCSFCGQGQDDVNQIISGPDVCICDMCIRDCVKILTEKGHWPPIGMRGVPADKASFYRGLMALAGYIGPNCVATVTGAMGDQPLSEEGHEPTKKSPESAEPERSEGGLQ